MTEKNYLPEHELAYLEYILKAMDLRKELCLKYAHLGVQKLIEVFAPFSTGGERKRMQEEVEEYLKDFKE